jgi:hypothetical protein
MIRTFFFKRKTKKTEITFADASVKQVRSKSIVSNVTLAVIIATNKYPQTSSIVE